MDKFLDTRALNTGLSKNRDGGLTEADFAEHNDSQLGGMALVVYYAVYILIFAAAVLFVLYLDKK